MLATYVPDKLAAVLFLNKLEESSFFSDPKLEVNKAGYAIAAEPSTGGGEGGAPEAGGAEEAPADFGEEPGAEAGGAEDETPTSL